MTLEEVKSLLSKRNERGADLNKARKENDFASFVYSQKEIGKKGNAYYDWILKVFNGNSKKVEQYAENFFYNPVPEVVDRTLPELKKAANAIDRRLIFEFGSDVSQNGFQDFIDSAYFMRYFKEDAFRAMFAQPISIIGVCPDDGFYTFKQLNLNKVTDYYLTSEGIFKYLAFNYNGYFLIVCDQYYRFFKEEAQPDSLTLLSEFEHGLGYCPFTFLYDTPNTTNDSLMRAAPSSIALQAAKFSIFAASGVEYLQSYGKYPIFSKVHQECTITGCNDGIRIIGGIEVPCACASSGFVGAGSQVEVVLSEDMKDMPEPVKIIAPDRNLLDFNNEDIDKRINNLFILLSGGSAEILNKAVNEKQVEAVFEAKKGIINNIARKFEKAHKFILETYAKLMYNDFIRAEVDYGTLFVIETAEYLNEALKKAKENGAGLAKVLALQEQINLAESGSQAELMRSNIINMINPYEGLNFAEYQNLLAAEIISKEDFDFYLQLPTLIQRYELSVRRIGIDSKGEIVKGESLTEYLNELINNLKLYIK